MAVWALSSFKSRLSKIQYERLISLLDDSFLQVRTSGCVALGALGSDVSLSGLFNHDLVFDKLLKCLKDGRVNRETVCETLMAFPRGPELLLQTAKANKNTPLVLRAVVKAFKSLDPKDPLAENIAREVLEAAR